MDKEKPNLAALIVGRLDKKDSKKSSSLGEDPALVSVAEDLCDSLKDNDYDGVAAALRAAFDVLSVDSDRPEEDDEEPFEDDEEDY